MFVVDTNILIYAADSQAPEHPKCRELLSNWRMQASPWYLTWGIIYEFLRVSTHPNVFRKPLKLSEAWGFVEAILASPSLELLQATDLHSKIVSEVFNDHPFLSGNLLFDAHTVILMKEHGIKKIYTRDADFHRFKSLEVVDPLSTGKTF